MPVYNIEVEGDHVYRVGHSGVLVHNISVPQPSGSSGSSSTCNPCDQLNIGIDSQGNTFDDRKHYTRKTVNVFDDRGPKFTSTRHQHIDQDVIVRVIARLKHKTGGTDPDTKAHAWVQCVVGVKKDDAGHVIGDSLGGGGKLADQNIFPQNLTRNRGVQSAFEKNVVKPAIGVHDVCIWIELLYSNTSSDYPGRPTKTVYKAWINNKEETREYDNNFPPNAFEPVPGAPNYCSEQSK